MGGQAEEGLGKMFRDPNMWGKLAANPKTAPLLADPQFAAQVSHFILCILYHIVFIMTDIYSYYHSFV